MIQTGIDKRVQVQQLIENQLPEFILSESPKSVDFLKQYYISQEYQGGPLDLADNLDQYLKLDNLTPEVITGQTTLLTNITSSDITIQVSSTKGFPSQYGLLKIDDEIITYTGITTNTFTGCIRGFSGITNYRSNLNPDELVFEETNQESHTSGATVINLSSLFLREFYKKLKYSLTPGLENVDFVSDLDVNNFIKQARAFYQAKGTEESFRILFNVLYGVNPKVIDLEQYLLKPSSAKFLRREIVVAEAISGEAKNLIGQTIKKSSDENTQAAVSEVEVFARPSVGIFYRLYLFVGYEENEAIQGNFTIQPKTRVINNVSIGSSTIIVDSTVGFESSGNLICGNNLITYTDRTVNQFLGCSGITENIQSKSDIRNDEYYYGYENGDPTKEVRIRLTGVLSKYESIVDNSLTAENEKIYVKNVGERILNPDENKTYKQIFSNSWIYNTSSRFNIESINGSNFNIETDIDKSQLKVGDSVNIMNGSTENVVHSNAIVSIINNTNRQIVFDNLSGFVVDNNQTYTFRRNLNTASSSQTPIFYGNNIITSDIQNVYNENDEYMYVASNSLPSYTITNAVKKSVATIGIATFFGFNQSTEKYSIIAFPTSVPFLTGDEVYYSAESDTLNGIEEGNYFVKVLSPNNRISLHQARSLIDANIPVEFDFKNITGSHTFTLNYQKEEVLYPQKLLKKFPLQKNIKSGSSIDTKVGSIGMLINGVEILNYKSLDKIYYGPINEVKVYNKGKDYDVINTPTVVVNDPIVSSGTTALIQPVISGNVKEVLVDPQDFDILSISAISISGGNGSGAVFQPVLEKRNREVFFSPKPTTEGGGVNVVNNTITFTKQHYFTDGMSVIYDNKADNTASGISTIQNVGIATLLGSTNNNNVDNTLSNGSLYYVKVIGNHVGLNTVQLYTSKDDALSGINTIGLTTQYGSGLQAFRVYEPKNTLKSVKVIEPGTNYRNRKLIAKPSNISISDDFIVFENHGFNDGDIVEYSNTISVGNTISIAAGGLSTTTSYYILKEDNDKFRLANAGIGATILTNYTRRNFVGITSVGAGYHIFSYPKVSMSISVNYGDITGIGQENVGIITLTPIVRGEIIDAYLYEEGSGYGSKTLNFHNRPPISIKSSVKDSEFKLIIDDGSIVKVQVMYGGSGYTSAPDLIISGSGIGARLRAIINSSGSVTDVVVLNPGVGYDNNTTVFAKPVGLNGTIYASVRDLTVNRYIRYGDEAVLKNLNGSTGLQYSVIGYFKQLQNNTFEILDTNNIVHSPIIGWAYDGNPIYGPYSYAVADDVGSSVIALQSGYVLNTSKVVDRPSEFVSGFFVEDYEFDNSGNLDEYNGRFGKTPEFPNGTYAYFASVDTNSTQSTFPYFIGNSYKSVPVEQTLDQDFDFNSTTLIRNTLPYKVFDEGANNDFLLEPYEIIPQSATIESITKGNVEGFIVNETGDFYKVGDVAIFDSSDTGGSGLAAEVNSIKGKDIVDITSSVELFTDSSIVWKNSSELLVQTTSTHGFNNGDLVIISGISTFIPGLTKSHTIGIISESTYLLDQLSVNSTAGVVTDIYVTTNPNFISVGSTLGIGTERVRVLNVFPENKVIRIERGVTGTAHTDSAEVFVVPDTFTIPVSVEYFEPALDTLVYFNPQQSIGIGTISGFDVSNDYKIGQLTTSISVPTQTIYIPNHPFKTNQEIILTIPSGANTIGVADTPGSTPFTIPQTGNTETLFVINKSKNTIGLTTQVGLTTQSNGLFFTSFTANGNDDDFKYSLESNFTQVTARVEKVTATVALSTSHELTSGDLISLNVKPNQSIGIGTSSSIKVKYNSDKNKLLINPIGFSSIGVNSTSNEITLVGHGLKTGEKVFYEYTGDSIVGLETGSYYVYRIDDNRINLTETYYDAITANPPIIVSFGSTGGSNQELSLINPQLTAIKNNNLVFDVSDSSLIGYDFKFFTDKNFNNEFVSVGSGTTFNVIGVGTVGVSTNATLTLNYEDDLPLQIYYNIESFGYISTSDKDVKNGSQIFFLDSTYNGNFKVSAVGLGSTTFQINLKSVPEVFNHTQDTTSVLEYSTTSLSAKGGVNNMKINYGGQNYKKLPQFVTINSAEGVSADIIPLSTNIGKIQSVKINNPGFDYAADKTLSPEVYVSPNITVINRSTVSEVEVIYGGSNYTTPPNLVLVNPDTEEVYTNGFLEAKLQGTSIATVDVIAAPSGISETLSKVYAVDNSNGSKINQVSSSVGFVTFSLATPLSGLSTSLFFVGEKVYVEGVELYSDGEGFNSEDHNYTFFTVTSYAAGPSNQPAKLTVSLTGITTNPGVAKTNQSGYATVIKESDYPVFKVSQVNKQFNDGEKLSTVEGSALIPRNLVITESLNDQIKVYGSYELKENDVVVGSDSGTRATIKSIEETKSFFRVDYSLRKDVGWSDDIGKLSLDYQVIPDNDYYQNLSYTVKSPITYDELVTPVNNLLHTTGLKNFADVELLNVVGFGTTTIQQSTTFSLIDLISDNRVDTINNFDYGLDVDVLNNKSKFVKVQNRKLTDYIKCITNRVLFIDDISDQFSSGTAISNLYIDIDNFNIDDGYNRFLVQIVDPSNNEVQATEIITLPSVSGDIITVEKASIYNTNFTLGDVSANLSESGSLSLRFTPTEQYTQDYDIKILKNNFNSELSGIGTQSLGFINLTGLVNVPVGVGSTATIIEVSTNTINALFVISEVINPVSEERTYVEMYVDHNGTDTNVSEYFFDNNQSTQLSSNFIGTFTSDISSGTLSLSFQNTNIGIGSTSLLIRSKIVGFGTTASGISTYTFTSNGQTADQADTVQLQSNFVESTGISTILSLTSSDVTTIKTIARVGYGNTTALHQLLVINDGTDVYTTQYSYLSSTSTGIGTFSAVIFGSNLDLRFYPDSGISTDVSVQSYSEIIKSNIDLINDPNSLSYGPITENVSVSQYNGINGNRVNVTSFELNHDGTPIFMKKFNPSDSAVLNPVTGVFTIKNHFFSTGEELIYRSGDTFGNSTLPVSIGETSSGGIGIGTTTILPSTVYAIKLNNDQFKIATVASFATTSTLGADNTPGIGVTFTNVTGIGNAHELEMVKKIEKSIISIDGVVQSPIAYTPINHQLLVGISETETIFALSGISSITPGNILKIDDEYVNVTSIGFGTTSSGPITGVGTTTLVEVERGFVGSSATSHVGLSTVRVYVGSFNIVKNKIHFSEAPLGDPSDILNTSELLPPQSTFNGRVYLRNDYSSNYIYDNISESFTGIGQTYILTVGGVNTTGIETGSGVLFINNIFQTPSTDNNAGNNYEFSESAGISSVVFSGIQTSGGILISEYDVNQNQLPRGGIIVSLASTTGLGFAPLVGASVTAVVGAGGSIVSVGFGSTDIYGSGYFGTVSVAITETGHTGAAATITATVGAGGTLSFNITGPGTGYTNPSVFVSEPSYSNLGVVGVSRLGIGTTTETGSNLLLNLEVGAANTSVGIGSTLFEVKSFNIARPGYGFKKGDVFKPVGLVTAAGLSSPISDFELTVLETFSDSFSAWQFGELDYIDSIKPLQNGVRTRFPLYYNNELLSIETDPDNSDSLSINLDSVLLIFINGVIQEPGDSYTFDGGSSFIFSEAPKEEDNVSIFFYRGTRGIDSIFTEIRETIKIGDEIKIRKNDLILTTRDQESNRTLVGITTSDTFETDIYTGLGIDSVNYKPFDWIKQKVDKKINNQSIYKTRDTLEAQIYPSAKVIGDFSTSDTEIFVDNGLLFEYETQLDSPVTIQDVDLNALIIGTTIDPVAAGFTATVSVGGTISNIDITNGGSGYTGGFITLSIAPPPNVSTGNTAMATATVGVAGTITSVSIISGGSGYSTSIIPKVLAPTTNVSSEVVTEFGSTNQIQNFVGVLTGITTSVGTGGHPLSVTFNIVRLNNIGDSLSDLQVNYPIYIYNTFVGSGVTSVNDSDSAIVGIGTTYMDNVYIISAITSDVNTGIITCNVHSGINTIGINTSGIATSNPVGNFSVGRISGFTRSINPISIGVTGLTIDAGLSTFPHIERRSNRFGLRDTGALIGINTIL